MNRKLTPWLVVALVAGAFATGLLGAVIIVGGPSADHVTSGSQSTSTTTASTPAAAGATAARAQTSSAAHRSASARATTSRPARARPKAPAETSQGTGGTPANSPAGGAGTRAQPGGGADACDHGARDSADAVADRPGRRGNQPGARREPLQSARCQRR